MDMKEFMDDIRYGIEPSGPVDGQEPWWLAGGLQKMVVLQAVEEVGSDLPLRRYTPANPPSSEHLKGITILNAPKRSYDENRMMFESIKSVLDKEPISQLRIVEEKPTMRTLQIVNLYFERARDAFEIAVKDKLKKLCEEDENVRMIRASFADINAKLKPGAAKKSIHLSEWQERQYLSQDTCDKIDEFSKKEEEERKRISRLYEEVEAQLMGCDTYENECSVLRIYGIIDTCGKMAEYKITF